jgi:hypothetical protein
MLQGRVQLDADWNEQMAILWHYLRTLTTDLVGAGWGPGDSYRIRYTGHDSANPPKYNFEAAPGHYYVHGLLTRTPEKAPLQLPIPFADSGQELIWLRVWERLVTSVEDDDIREVALGGADTAARTKVVQKLVAAAPPPKVTRDTALYYRIDPERLGHLLGQGAKEAADHAGLRARVHPASDNSGAPCVVPADAGYRGLENQLYRVEIYKGGAPADKGGATFLWSRDNGSVLAQWVKTDGWKVTVQGIGREGLSGFTPGQWVQLLDDDSEEGDKPDQLFARVQAVAGNVLTLDKAHASATTVPSPDPAKHPKVRRWDIPADSPGALPVQVPSTNDGYVPLEDGIEVQFEAGKTYTPGDYWLIPARTALADGIEWPTDTGVTPATPALVPPRRAESYKVPLAYVTFKSGEAPDLIDLRKGSPWLAKPQALTQSVLPNAQKSVGVPAGVLLLFRLFASGVRVYKVKKVPPPGPPTWDLDTLWADLFDEQGHKVGILSKDDTGLIWRANDGSQVTPDPNPTTVNAPEAGDMGWFLATAKKPAVPFGIFAPVVSIQQVYTVGGQAPASPPTADAPQEVPFLATYYFYSA